MEKYCWPGNVRQLQHTIERSVILSDGSYIDLEYLGENDHHEASLDPDVFLDLTLNERKLVMEALTLSKGNISKAAGLLGINRSTVYDKIKKHGL